MANESDTDYRQVYRNQKVVSGLMAYASRLRGELLRADRDSKKPKADLPAIGRRRDHYAALLAHVEVVGMSLAGDVDWSSIEAKVSAPDYRTNRSDLRIELLRFLKHQLKPVSVNDVHAHVIERLKLEFDSKEDRKKHRAVVVEALHDLRRGPPSVIACTEQCEFGKPNQPTQRWYFVPRPPRPGW